jgi:hypothetical protein
MAQAKKPAAKPAAKKPAAKPAARSAKPAAAARSAASAKPAASAPPAPPASAAAPLSVVLKRYVDILPFPLFWIVAGVVVVTLLTLVIVLIQQ